MPSAQRERDHERLCSVAIKEKRNSRIRISELLAKPNLNRLNCNLNLFTFSFTYSEPLLSHVSFSFSLAY